MSTDVDIAQTSVLRAKYRHACAAIGALMAGGMIVVKSGGRWRCGATEADLAALETHIECEIYRMTDGAPSFGSPAEAAAAARAKAGLAGKRPIKARIYDQGIGWPKVGSYVCRDGTLYRVAGMFPHMHFCESDPWVHAALDEASWNDMAHGESPHPCRVEICS